jgi:hypothetical protein
MPTPAEILREAKREPERQGLDAHREAINTLREKGFTWREVADFLRERGVDTDHTKLFRFMQRKEKSMNTHQEFSVPPASKYAEALKGLKISDIQRDMLRAHYEAHNRTINYTDVAAAGGSDSHSTANSHYGKLGRSLGEALNFNFIIAEKRGKPFYSSALGMDNPYKPEGEEYQLVMHHELAKAIEQLGWFKQ